MIVGDDSMLMRNVREEFQQTGVYHLLVVRHERSVAGICHFFWLTRRLRLPEWPASLLTIGLSVFYAYIAGMGVPIMRAVLMLALVSGGAPSLSRPQRTECHWLRRARGSCAFSCGPFRRRLPIDLSRAVSHHGHLPAYFGAGALHLIAPRCITLIPPAMTWPWNRRLRSFGWICGLIAGRLAQFIGARAGAIIVTGAAAVALGFFELLLVSAITQAVLVLPMRAYFHRAAILGMPR